MRAVKAMLVLMAVLALGLARGDANPGVRVMVPGSDINLATAKVAHLVGDVTDESADAFVKELATTSDLPGDRVILINSLGGEVEAGTRMIRAMLGLKQPGTRNICVVTGEAMSMAFNLLSFCDTRLGVKGAKLLAHKIALGSIPEGMRLTSRLARDIAGALDRDDEMFRQQNAKALGVSLEQYDSLADAQFLFKAEMLVNWKYLQGIATVN